MRSGSLLVSLHIAAGPSKSGEDSARLALAVLSGLAVFVGLLVT